MRIFRALFLISIVLLFGAVAYQKSGLRKSRISVDGEPVAEAEAQQSVQEMSDFAKGIDPNRSPSPSEEAKTKFGRLMKEMVQSIRLIEAWHAAQTKDLGLDSILANASLRSRSSIQLASKRLTKLEAIETEYFHRREDLVDAYSARLGRPDSLERRLSNSRSLLEGLLSAEKKVFAAGGDYLTFARVHKHQVDPGGKFVSWDSADLPQAKRLLATIDEKLIEVTKVQAEVDSRAKDSQQKISELANSMG